jgi:DNA-binding transcriptional regulator YhcF (GntR family)
VRSAGSPPRTLRAEPAAGVMSWSLAVLAEHYAVSKATVTRTLRILADEGLVRVVPRWGTFRAEDN